MREHRPIATASAANSAMHRNRIHSRFDRGYDADDVRPRNRVITGPLLSRAQRPYRGSSPKRRVRLAYTRKASRRWEARKSGQSTSRKTNSAYAAPHSRKFDKRYSPAVRMIMSGSGMSGN